MRLPASSLIPIPCRVSRGVRTLCLVALLALPGLGAAAREKLELRHQQLELPGPPAAVLASDVNGDGLEDLVVVVVFTLWEQIGIEETTRMDGVEGLVEVLTIVPAILDHRELFVFLSGEDGGYHLAGAPLPLEASVLSLAAGPPSAPIVALTDQGISLLRSSPEESRQESTEENTEPAFRLEPHIDSVPVLAGTSTFISRLDLMHDLDGDGDLDLLFPAPQAFEIYLTTENGLSTVPAFRWPLPADDQKAGSRSRHYPLPEIRDLDGDGRPELLLRHPKKGWGKLSVASNQGGGRFGRSKLPLDQFQKEGDGEEVPGDFYEVVLFDDIDGDGLAEVLAQREVDQEADGMREEMAEAKNPFFDYRIYRQLSGGGLEAEPSAEFSTEGYAFEGGGDLSLPGGLQDLDGDGDLDLVTLTLDFSLMQAVKVLTTQRIGIGLDFHVWCQEGEGTSPTFRRVPGLDLSGKFHLNLNDLKVRQLSQFRGDFDGDGRQDFVQMGRGKKISIHRGREGCSYPSAPDLVLTLEEEPRDLSLVQVRELDGDGLSDILVIHPLEAKEAGVTPPVRLHLYVSEGAR